MALAQRSTTEMLIQQASLHKQTLSETLKALAEQRVIAEEPRVEHFIDWGEDSFVFHLPSTDTCLKLYRPTRSLETIIAYQHYTARAQELIKTFPRAQPLWIGLQKYSFAISVTPIRVVGSVNEQAYTLSPFVRGAQATLYARDNERIEAKAFRAIDRTHGYIQLVTDIESHLGKELDIPEQNIGEPNLKISVERRQVTLHITDLARQLKRISFDRNPFEQLQRTY